MGRRSQRRTTAVALSVCILVLVACGDDGLADRRAEVARRGAEVMPFDLDATRHTFTNTSTGGVQLVTALDANDRDQVDLVRHHLREERERFSRGDFTDPAAIHGMDMPGVSELSEGYERFVVNYEDRPGGASLVYTTDDPEMIRAIHAWFDRQVMDHGVHARSG